MSYCPKCGNKVDETMTFCPRCGASLKGTAAPSQAAPAPSYRNEKAEKNEKQEKNQHSEKGEKQEKSEHGFVGYLVGGLILISIGIFTLINLTNPSINSGQNFAAMLLVIGVIIIIAAIYLATSARKRFPPTS